VTARWRWLRRLLAVVASLALVGYVLHGVDTRRVLRVLWHAGPWLPVVLALELLQMLSDVAALRILLREKARDIPKATWVRSSAVAYGMMVLLPAGRAAGEVTRATLLAAHVGASRAATASGQLQAAYLFGNATASLAACAAVASCLGARAPLAGLLAGNALFMTATAAVLVAVLWNLRIGRWIDWLRRFVRIPPDPEGSDSTERRTVPWKAAIACCLGRGAQLVQYGVILVSVGGGHSPRSALIAHGIHLVGATLGDMLPNQLGVVDGTYRAFAPALGLARTPERAVSIAFLAHVMQILLAIACVLLANLMGASDGSRGEKASSREGAHS
jgi:uncharacterized membrane protein YbhN (UPF0104 family)